MIRPFSQAPQTKYVKSNSFQGPACALAPGVYGRPLSYFSRLPPPEGSKRTATAKGQRGYPLLALVPPAPPPPAKNDFLPQIEKSVPMSADRGRAFNATKAPPKGAEVTS